LNLKAKSKYLFIFCAIILVDQVSKLVVKSTLELYGSRGVIKGFFQVIHVQNSGAVWGILSHHPNVLVSRIITALSMFAIALVVYYFIKMKPECTLELTALSFIIGGAIGNLIDRLSQGYVVDFLDVYIKNAHWPTFNVADSFITSGVILLIVSLWRGKCFQS